MQIPPKRTTFLDRIAKWRQVGVRSELLLHVPRAHSLAMEALA